MDTKLCVFTLLSFVFFYDLFAHRLDYSGFAAWKKNGLEVPDLHGINMTFSWMILPFLGQIATFHFNYKKQSGNIHSLAGIVTCLGTATTAVFLTLDGYLGRFDSGTHAYCGLIIFAVAFLQIAAGVYFKADLMWGKFDSLETANKLKNIHIWVGYPGIALSVWQVYTGVSMRWPKFLPVIYYWYTFILAIEIILFFWPRLDGKPIQLLPEIAEGQVKNITDYDSLREMSKQKKSVIMMFENGIYDLGSYARDHPGGAAMLKTIPFHEDVGRYLDGGYGYSENIPPHIHSREAMKLLLPQYKIGDLQSKVCPMSGLKEPTNEWVLAHKHTFTSEAGVFYFTPKDGSSSSAKPRLDYIGKHVRIEMKVKGEMVVRYYTPVFSLTPERAQRRNAYNDHQDSSKPHCPESAISVLDPGLNTTLPICIKRYPVSDAKMSPHLHDLQPDQFDRSPIRISKPSGVGLGLTNESYGLHIALVAGTGVLPFLDLYDMIMQGLTKDTKDGDSNTIPPEFYSSFQLKTYACFRSRDQAYGLHLMEQCDKTCQSNGINTANFHFFFTQKGQRLRSTIVKFNEEQFLEAKKVYVCGPPGFNDAMVAALLAIGRQREDIFLIQ